MNVTQYCSHWLLSAVLWPVQLIPLFVQCILTELLTFISIHWNIRFKQCLIGFIFICNCYSRTRYIICLHVHHTRDPSTYQQLPLHLVWHDSQHFTLPSPTLSHQQLPLQLVWHDSQHFTLPSPLRHIVTPALTLPSPFEYDIIYGRHIESDALLMSLSSVFRTTHPGPGPLWSAAVAISEALTG